MNADIPILILDDDRLARLDLAGLLRALPGAGAIREAASGDAAMAKIGDARVLFVDVELGERTGFDFVARVPDRANLAVVFTTGHAEYAARAFDTEATDYLLKPVEPARLRKAWRRALAEIGRPLPPSRGETPAIFPTDVKNGALSVRENEVLHWLTQGKSNPEIAGILGIGRGTVKRHLENIYAKIGVENRHAAIVHALHDGVAG